MSSGAHSARVPRPAPASRAPASRPLPGKRPQPVSRNKTGQSSAKTCQQVPMVPLGTERDPRPTHKAPPAPRPAYFRILLSSFFPASRFIHTGPYRDRRARPTASLLRPELCLGGTLRLEPCLAPQGSHPARGSPSAADAPTALLFPTGAPGAAVTRWAGGASFTDGKSWRRGPRVSCSACPWHPPPSGYLRHTCSR